MTNDELNKVQMIYEIYEQPMFRIAYAVLNNTQWAEDAVSDAFMRIIKKIGKINEANSDKTKRYIVKIIKSSAIDQYRKNKNFYEHFQTVDESTYLIPDDNTDIENNDYDDDEINNILKNLNETDKKIIILRCCDELSWNEVAEKMSMTETAVRKRFERARKRLITMKGEMYDEEKISV